MKTIVRALVAVLAAILGFVLTTVGVTALLAPQIEFSLLVGLPVGVYAGLTALFATFVGLWYRDQTATGTPTEGVTRGLWAAGGAVLGFLGTVAFGLGLYLGAGMSMGLTVLLFGVPAVLLVAGVVGFVAARLDRDGDAGRRFSSG
ncbi:hypothetical protein [Haloarchaeobius amylolyticus]|uniref:hypothetical protein n=1 Tax=Haloarchaeobius amylolyticus TaxID=1198296 RepID=UPI0022701DEB|nr:hypothetical protein [Haloarchaeobius amylolyticus]